MIEIERQVKVVLTGHEELKNLVDVLEFARRYTQTEEAKKLYGDDHVSHVCAFIGNMFANCKE